jgi:hypothetical protein
MEGQQLTGIMGYGVRGVKPGLFRNNGSKFRIQWSPAGNLDPIPKEMAGGWTRAEGDIPQRFAVRIYRQKQIFQLANAPLALPAVVDEAPEVDRRSRNARWREEEGRFLSLLAKAREIETGLAGEPRLRGELDDPMRKLAVFEQAGRADVLKAFQRRRRQRQAVDAWEESWSGTADRLRLSSVPKPLRRFHPDRDPSELRHAHPQPPLDLLAPPVCLRQGDLPADGAVKRD